MPVSIDEEKYIKNLLTSVIDYTKTNIPNITVSNKSYTLTYDYSFPKNPSDLETKLPCIIFDHIGTSQDKDWGMGNYKKYMTTIQIQGFAGKGSNERINEQMRVNLMSLLMKHLSDKYAIPFKENNVEVASLQSKCSVRKLEPTSNSEVDLYRFIGELNLKLAYKR